MKKLSLILVALVLSACGSGGGDGGVDVGVNPTLPPPVLNPSVDAFFTRVNGFASFTSETEEPGDISLVNVTEPDTTEPEML